MYRQLWNGIENKVSTAIVLRLTDNAYIPTDPANTDYVNFKREINDETAQLQDANGVLMTPEQAKQFVSTLP